MLGLAVIVHGVARETITLALTGRGAGAEGGPLPDGDTRLRFWLVAATDTALALVVAAALLMSWGLAWADLRGWLADAADGVRIGSFRFSITDLLFAASSSPPSSWRPDGCSASSKPGSFPRPASTPGCATR